MTKFANEINGLRHDAATSMKADQLNEEDIRLIPIPKSDPQLRRWMADHYSAPKGFVGRQLVYRIEVAGIPYGAVAAGSAILWLPGRPEFFREPIGLNHMVNQTFFHVEKINGRYPMRNFTSAIVAVWRGVVAEDWRERYGDDVLGWETLVEPPRTGELYRRDGWHEIGRTRGFSCKRVAGMGTDGWSGRREWTTDDPRPKRVFARTLDGRLAEPRAAHSGVRRIRCGATVPPDQWNQHEVRNDDA